MEIIFVIGVDKTDKIKQLSSKTYYRMKDEHPEKYQALLETKRIKYYNDVILPKKLLKENNK